MSQRETIDHNIKINMPADVKTIISTLENAGFEAYAVGGCVRDSLLGREPNDWDITTNAKPEQTKELFHRTIDTGLQHGTVTILMNHVGYEVTTYRIDGSYEDSRHPSSVTFTSDLTEDLKRRDFTINAMAYNDRSGIVDVFHGIEDMEKKIIRAVGDPCERFTEDALRIMRAVRFSAQLGYEIEEETKKAITSLAPTLANISAERIQVELVKLVTSAHPEKMMDIYETGIGDVILPEFVLAMNTVQNNPHHMYSVGEHIVKSMTYIEADRYLRLAMLIHDLGKPVCKTTDEKGIDHFYGHPEVSEQIGVKILRRLKFDNDTIRMVSILVRFHDYRFGSNKKALRRAMNKIGKDAFPLVLKVQQADILAQSSYQRDEKQNRLDEANVLYKEILKDGECVDLKSLAITGSDLIAWGMKPGKEIGEVLSYLLDLVIEEPSLNNQEDLYEKYQQFIEK